MQTGKGRDGQIQELSDSHSKFVDQQSEGSHETQGEQLKEEKENGR